MTAFLTIKNWERFQHYRDRAPPWIKLHRSLLDDFEFSQLPDETKAHLVLIWLFASQSRGRVPAEPTFLASKLGLRKAPNLQLLVEQGFLIPEHDASNVLAERKQGASELLQILDNDAPRAGARSASASGSLKTEPTGIARAREAGPTDKHRELATSLGVACDVEWASFWDRVDAKGKPWFRDANAAFRLWLRQERKYAERDGRIGVNGNAGAVHWE